MSHFVLPFEKPILELEAKLHELQSVSQNQDLDVSSEIARMEKKISQMRQKIYGNLTAWQKVQMARHPLRPYTRDYIQRMCSRFDELHGDRIYRDDRAIIGGFAEMDGQRFMLIGTQKGRDTKSNLECNFGCPYPEGYRKALRLMRLAEKFRLPIVSLIDTPGAYPGIQSEERHVAEAIAVNLRECFTFSVPMVVVITGEGGSGGALGIGIGNRVLVLENAYYSVITPEGCAAILWKDRAYSDKAAEALKLTAQDLKAAGITDDIVPEPMGGAHTDYDAIAATLKKYILDNLQSLRGMSADQLKAQRYERFRRIGAFGESKNPPPGSLNRPDRKRKAPAEARTAPPEAGQEILLEQPTLEEPVVEYPVSGRPTLFETGRRSEGGGAPAAEGPRGEGV